MIQFNLLPDVKQEFVKTQRTKHLLTLVSFVASAGAIGLLILSVLTVDVVQKKNLHDLNNDISKYSTQLKNVPDLNKILTVQNQLGTLTSLHDQKPVTSRLFQYLAQMTPADASLDNLNIDFTANTLTVGGSAPSLDVVSTYAATFKSATYYTDSSSNGKTHPFSNVVLSSFGRDDQGATFTITSSFDPAIFNTDNKVTLVVPQTATVNQSNIFGEGN